jgi:hypothetical protein
VVDAGTYSLSETLIAGAGQRLVEIAQVLSNRFKVYVIAAKCADLVDLGDAELVAGGAEAESAIKAADAVLFFDTPDHDRVELAVAYRRLIVAECRPPIEHLEFPSLLAHPDPTGEYQRYLGAFRRLLHVGHHYLCRSQAERIAMISTLCAFGRLRPSDIARSRTLDHLLSTVPVGFNRTSAGLADAAEPQHMGDFLWTGGMWAFYQPVMLVEAMRVLRGRGVDTTAAFMYANVTPDTEAAISRVREAVDEYGLGDRVFLNSKSLAMSQRDQYLKAARGYVCVTSPGIENETATRLRLRDTWLHGIPVIIDPFGNSADIVGRERLGVVLENFSPAGLAEAMERIKHGAIAPPGRRVEHLYEATLVRFMDWLTDELRAT